MIYNNSANPGDLKAFDVTIDGKSVIDAVISADVYQDIFTPTWTAQVFFDDTSNLLTALPIKAGKEIKIKVKTEYGGFAGDGEKEFTMVVYRIGDKIRVNHMHQTYTVYAADPAFVANQKKRVQRSFKNKLPNEIAQTIVSEELGGACEVHDADNAVSLVIPNWSPFNAAGWLCKVGQCKGAADYCFFQTDTGKFAFKSFEKMFSSDEERIDVTFVQRPEGIKNNGDYADDFSLHVQRYAWQHFDGVSAMASGLYKSKTVSFDLINKKWDFKVFSFGDDTPEDAESKNFEESMAGEDANISFTPKHGDMFEKTKSVLDYADDWIGSRKSAVQKMDMEKLVIQIPGSIKAADWVGKNVMVDLPSEQDLEDEKLDKYRKGRYVIVAICHNIKKSAYSTNIELVKKRLEKV